MVIVVRTQKQNKMSKKKSIDKVTVSRLKNCLRIIGVDLPDEVIDKTIDLVELIEKKGGKTSLKDISKLESEWSKLYH